MHAFEMLLGVKRAVREFAQTAFYCVGQGSTNRFAPQQTGIPDQRSQQSGIAQLDTCRRALTNEREPLLGLF